MWCGHCFRKSQIYSFMPVISQKVKVRVFFYETVHYDVHKQKMFSE